MRTLLAFILGLVIGFFAHSYFTQRNSGDAIAQARADASQAGQKIKDAFDADAIKEELSRSGQVIREKARQAGHALNDAAANARITTEIKAKLLKDSALSALAIDVDTTDGVVTLSGAVSSHEHIARAMKLALNTEGVHKVVSSLQVKPPAQ